MPPDPQPPSLMAAIAARWQEMSIEDAPENDFISKLTEQLGEPKNPAAEWLHFQKCPYCPDSDYKVFYVHSDTHNFKCHHCQEAGSKWKLAKTMLIELAFR